MGGSDYALSIEQPGMLTDGPDELFVWRMDEGDGALAVTELEVFARQGGGDTYALTFELTEDLDGDEKFGPGDAITVREPANIFGPDDEGSEISVELLEEDEAGVVTSLFEDVWVP